MIITPKVFLVAIATGLYWLLVLMTALFMVAGMARGILPFFWIGLAGSAICIIIRVIFRRNQHAIKAWALKRN